MPKRKPDLAAIIEEVLDEKASHIVFSNDEVERGVEELRAAFAQVDEVAVARRRIAAAMESLPTERRQGWLAGAQSAMKVVLGEARKSSRLLLEAAQGLLPAEPDAWSFAPIVVEATRGEAAPTKLESVDAASGMTRTVLVDDAGDVSRVLATIRNFPAQSLPPVLLIVEEQEGRGVTNIMEVDPEVIGKSSAGDTLNLRYEAELPAGAYFAFFGNPRKAKT
jgi:hypothetical protein